MTTTLVALASLIVAIMLMACGLYVFFTRRFLRRLRAHAIYSQSPHSDQWGIGFAYVSAEDEYLAKLRKAYRLSDIAGEGTDQERAIRLMRWVHGLTRHAINPSTPKDLSALNLIRLCQQEGKRINCWMYSIILNECLLSLGIPSRMVHLLPLKERPNESHFVVAVYVRESMQWIMIDPDMRGYFMDEQDNILGVAQIRKRLIAGGILHVSEELDLQGAQWLPRRVLTSLYRAYISKNLIRVACPQHSGLRGVDGASPQITYELIPDKYHREWLKQPRISTHGNARVYVNDEELFWQAPFV